MPRRRKSYIQKITKFIDRMRSNYWEEGEEGGEPEIDPETNSIENVEMDLSKNEITAGEIDTKNHIMTL